MHSPKTKSCHDANFVITGATGGCRYDNPGDINVNKIGISFPVFDLAIPRWLADWYTVVIGSSKKCMSIRRR